MVSQPFATRGNRSYLDLYVLTSILRYPGYKTLTIAPKPSIERVTEDVHSMGGRIGTHMELLVLLQDSVVRPWG
jgi:hypothetical protein